MARCIEEGCDEPRVTGGDFCSRHIAEPRRCRATKRSNGERCKNAAKRGLRYCEQHGGAGAKATAKSNTAKAITAMQRFVKPYEGDIDPVAVFEAEFRRTLGRIRWYDEQLSLLASEEDLIWGRTKEVHVGAGEFTGTDVTYEARVNTLEQLQRWERKHLLDMEKVWIQANLDERKLNLMKRYVEATYVKVIEAVRLLGLDPTDKRVRDVLAAVLLDEGGDYVDRTVPALPQAPERP